MYENLNGFYSSIGGIYIYIYIHITKESMYENLSDFYSSIGGIYTLPRNECMKT